jgi:ketosteroid isomerase-like protein
MTDHPNADLVRNAYEGGPEAAIAALADDVKWHFPGRSHVAGDFEGKGAVLEHLAALQADFEVSLFALLADDKFAIAIEHVTAERNGKQYDRHDVAVFRIKGGKIAEVWVYPESQYELDDLLS